MNDTENNAGSPTPKKRGRPPKNKSLAAEINSIDQIDSLYEYNTSLGNAWTIFTDCMIDMPYKIEDIQGYIKNPMAYNQQLRELAWWAYWSNGSVTSAIDYMRTMHTLDGVVICKSRGYSNKKPKNFEVNRLKMSSTLDKIKYRQFIRDALLKDSNDGISFYYFETTSSLSESQKFLSDIEVANIVDINEFGLNASIISLPVDWCKIIGRKNSSYIVAFDLKYFQQFDEDNRKRKLKAFPKEIRTAWAEKENTMDGSSWVRLDSNKTITTKIKSAMNEPWGIPLAICALDDILYADYFTNTKRAVLDDINNQIVYETFPEGKDKGICALTGPQQRQQHDTVKGALLNKTNAYGRSFFSLASGTKLDKLDVNIDIFDEKNENGIKDAVPSALGVASSSLNGNTKGNFATSALNLELVSGNVYSWITDIVSELNKCINSNIICDRSCIVDFYVLPTTYVNRDKFFGYMKSLYADCGGSLQAVIAASGMDVEGYLSMLDHETDNKFDEKYPPHQSMYTRTDKSGQGGRPSVDSNNPNTVQSKTNNSNGNPKPSSQ